jgi:predicted nucleotidyltransferase
MRNDELLSAIGDLALKTNASVGNASWYFFGSTHEGLPTASDIDLLVICETHEMADAVRRSVDLDQLTRPIHLSILTRAEESEVRFVEGQGCIQVV